MQNDILHLYVITFILM